MIKKLALNLLAFILFFSILGSTQAYAAGLGKTKEESHNYAIGYIFTPKKYSMNGTVTGNGVNLRKEPHTDSTILEQMYWGEQVLIDMDNSTMTFYAVKRVKTDTSGYASRQYIQISQIAK